MLYVLTIGPESEPFFHACPNCTLTSFNSRRTEPSVSAMLNAAPLVEFGSLTCCGALAWPAGHRPQQYPWVVFVNDGQAGAIGAFEIRFFLTQRLDGSLHSGGGMTAGAIRFLSPGKRSGEFMCLAFTQPPQCVVHALAGTSHPDVARACLRGPWASQTVIFADDQEIRTMVKRMFHIFQP